MTIVTSGLPCGICRTPFCSWIVRPRSFSRHCDLSYPPVSRRWHSVGAMAYRIQHSQIDGALSVVVTGQSTLAAAGCIARDIAALAAQESARCVLVDLRWLEDTVGMRAF